MCDEKEEETEEDKDVVFVTEHCVFRGFVPTKGQIEEMIREEFDRKGMEHDSKDS